MEREDGNASIFRVRCLGRRPRRDRHRWIGLTSGGWVTQTTASRMARDGADAAVVQGLLPICVAQSRQDANYV